MGCQSTLNWFASGGYMNLDIPPTFGIICPVASDFLSQGLPVIAEMSDDIGGISLVRRGKIFTVARWLFRLSGLKHCWRCISLARCRPRIAFHSKSLEWMWQRAYSRCARGLKLAVDHNARGMTYIFNQSLGVFGSLLIQQARVFSSFFLRARRYVH